MPAPVALRRRAACFESTRQASPPVSGPPTRSAGGPSGAVAETEHRDPDALAAWQAGYEQTGVCGVCGLFEIAGTMERMSQPDSARMAYERLVTHPSVQSAVQYESFALAPSYKRLGELYEAKGDRKKAADYYGRFVDLYQHADPELQHAVREVRERLGRLAQEPGT